MIARLKFRTEEARKRERIRFALRTSFITLSFVLIVGTALFGCHQDFLRIKNTYVKTDGVLNEKEIAAVVEAELGGSIFGIFPNDSVILSKNEVLEKKIYEIF